MMGRERNWRTRRRYNLDLVDALDVDGHGMPVLAPCDVVPDRLRSFNSCPRCSDPRAGVHFYIDDYRFEATWSDPLRYVDMLRRFGCVLTPDFSVYVDMPLPMQRWNVYRSRAIGLIWQRRGLNVIPTVSYGFPESYGFCFDGIPRRSVISISTVGLMVHEDTRGLLRDGVAEACRRLDPSCVLAFGRRYDFGIEQVPFVWYESEMQLRFEGMVKDGQRCKHGRREHQAVRQEAQEPRPASGGAEEDATGYEA